MSVQIPFELLKSLSELKGFEEDAFQEAHQPGQQITSIRLNKAKVVEQKLPSSLKNILAEKIPWCNTGYYLSQRPSFTLDPTFHAGAYYVQDASSMFIEQALLQSLDLSKPLKVLDLCAAPGGKSTLLQSLISKDSLLVSNEVIKTRVNVLSENISKWGAANVIVTNNDPQHFKRLENYFDLIVVDAPCSGSGLFRKDPSAINEWSENNVALCSQRQQRILADILPALKPGGLLIYSTCSYSSSENESITDWLMQTYSLSSIQLKCKDEWGIVETISPSKGGFGYRFYPHRVKGEGFFLSLLQKNEEPPSHSINKKKLPEMVSAKELAVIAPYILEPAAYGFIKLKETILALPINILQELPILQSALYIKKAGVQIGTLIRTALIPDHELAISNMIQPNLPTVAVNQSVALDYLRRAVIDINQVEKGWALLEYEGFRLGWIKMLGNRVNNYYPKDWRILNK